MAARLRPEASTNPARLAGAITIEQRALITRLLDRVDNDPGGPAGPESEFTVESAERSGGRTSNATSPTTPTLKVLNALVRDGASTRVRLLSATADPDMV